MATKKQEKERAKRSRILWTCARPQGSITPNKHKETRAQRKEIARKAMYEDC